MPIFRARTPVRFCDLGGWTDIRIVPHGYVLNLAATLYTHVTVESSGGDGVRLCSHDTDEEIHAQTVTDLNYDGKLDLLKAALRRGGPSTDIRITVRSDAPPASGLGSSAAVGVAVVAALSGLRGNHWLPYEIARESQALEVEELGLECGVQDQLAAAYGGINAMEVRYPEASVFPLPLSDATRLELEDRLLLVYTGRSRFSSAMHAKVIAAYQSGQRETIAAFETLEACARRGKDALLRGDLPAFAAAINDNWTAQKQLHPDITTPEVESLAEVTRAAGAQAFKLNGAGGGGTATLLCRRDRVAAVRHIVEELGMSVLPSRIDRRGLCMWQPPGAMWDGRS
jgi:D-glycero-alpha-D-manno-heptose-7-phosphate kinase